ncbi:hypothetical protein HY251_00090 [bacterium]|nr:hypothetical protein [bacterium]
MRRGRRVFVASAFAILAAWAVLLASPGSAPKASPYAVKVKLVAVPPSVDPPGVPMSASGLTSSGTTSSGLPPLPALPYLAVADADTWFTVAPIATAAPGPLITADLFFKGSVIFYTVSVVPKPPSPVTVTVTTSSELIVINTTPTEPFPPPLPVLMPAPPPPFSSTMLNLPSPFPPSGFPTTFSATTDPGTGSVTFWIYAIKGSSFPKAASITSTLSGSLPPPPPVIATVVEVPAAPLLVGSTPAPTATRPFAIGDTVTFSATTTVGHPAFLPLIAWTVNRADGKAFKPPVVVVQDPFAGTITVKFKAPGTYLVNASAGFILDPSHATSIDVAYAAELRDEEGEIDADPDSRDASGIFKPSVKAKLNGVALDPARYLFSDIPGKVGVVGQRVSIKLENIEVLSGPNVFDFAATDVAGNPLGGETTLTYDFGH